LQRELPKCWNQLLGLHS